MKTKSFVLAFLSAIFISVFGGCSNPNVTNKYEEEVRDQYVYIYYSYHTSDNSSLNIKLPENKKVKKGYKLTEQDLPLLPVTDDYSFDGYDHFVGNVINADTKITANFSKNNFIHYETSVGTAPEAVMVHYGEPLMKKYLPELSCPPSIFKGWQLPGSMSVGSPIYCDIFLYAQWEKYFTITYESEYGICPDPKVVPEGYLLTKEDLPDLEESGFVFEGWDSPMNYTVRSDMTIKARWYELPPEPEKVTYTITYVSEHGTVPESITVPEYYFLTAEDLPELTDEDYDFEGWNYSVGERIDDDTVITASWKKKQVTVTFKSNLKNKSTMTVDKGYVLKEDDFPSWSERKYRLDGWSVEPGIVINENTEITATFIEQIYISYSLPSNCQETMSQKTVDINYVLTEEDLPDLTFTYMDFVEWNYKAGDILESDITLIPQTEYTEYKFIYHSSIGTPPVDNSTYKNNFFVASSFTLCSMTVPGYKFLGWTLENDSKLFESSRYKKYSVVDFTDGLGSDEIHLYAQLEIIDYCVTYTTGESGLTAPEDENIYHYGDEVVIKAAPEKPGYTFTGWTNDNLYTSDTNKYMPGDIYVLKGNVSFTANYTPNSLSISFTSKEPEYYSSLTLSFSKEGSSCIFTLDQEFEGASVSWFMDGKLLAGETSSTLVIPLEGSVLTKGNHHLLVVVQNGENMYTGEGNLVVSD